MLPSGAGCLGVVCVSEPGGGSPLNSRPARDPSRGGDGLIIFFLGAVVGLLLGLVWASQGGPGDVVAGVGPFSSAAASQPGQARPAVRTVPATAPVRTSIPIPIAGRPLTLGVFGDSMADGLWAGLYRQLRDGKTYDVVRFSRPSTGLSRYDYVDVQSRTAEQLASRHVDVAVILFGTNDEQGIIQGRAVLAFNSPAWREVYAARIEALVGLLRRQGAAVYWVGLPKMGRPGFDERAQILNAIYLAKTAQLGVPFIATVPATVNAQGRYDDYLEASGRRQLMRARDGIHMTMAGYLRIATPVSGRIRSDVEATIARQASLTATPSHTGAGRP